MKVLCTQGLPRPLSTDMFLKPMVAEREEWDAAEMDLDLLDKNNFFSSMAFASS